ncbi:hypothetical protein ACO2Q7_11125 [Rathayibacter sp. KR2-224]|uniref:hypothetical protein n=1 Tax=Rathayibacter sp. KR2-224 TaxID=3400913 RepID=UPI003C0A58B0
MSRYRNFALSALTITVLAGASVIAMAAPAAASPPLAFSDSPANLFVGDSADVQITFQVPADAAVEELPTAASFSATPDGGTSGGAIAFSISSNSANLSDCTVAADGASGTCTWAGATPGDTETVSVHETGVQGILGVQHLRFTTTMPNGTESLAGLQDVTVLDRPVTATGSVSAATVPVGGILTVTATFTVSPTTPEQYLPQFVGFYVLQDAAADTSAFSFQVTSASAGASCQPDPGGKGIGCPLSGVTAGSTITISGTGTAGADPLGTHQLFLYYENAAVLGQTVKAGETVDVVPSSGSSSTPSGTTTPSSGVAGTDPSDPSAAAAAPAGSLAATGSEQYTPALEAALLLAAGATLTVVAANRRRRTRQD